MAEERAARTNTSFRIPILGSILASIAAVVGASCCLLPLIVFNLGMSGAWLAQLVFLQPLQPYLVGVSVITLAGGIFLYWRNYKRACAACEEAPRSNKLSLALLLLSTVLTLAAIIWPWVELPLLRALR